MFGNYWDGKILFAGNILFTVVFWAVVGAIFGYFASKFYSNLEK